MAEFLTPPRGDRRHVRDGDTVAMEGFTHLIPFAAGHEIIRQGARRLTLIRMTPDLIYDQLIGMGCAHKLVFSWGGNPGVGSLHRLRDAVEHGWPHPLELEEHSHAAMASAYAAARPACPSRSCAAILAPISSASTRTSRSITCPFTGERARRRARPSALTWAIIHAQRADRQGNVLIEGIIGVQKEVVLAARRPVVTVEEIVETCGRAQSQRGGAAPLDHRARSCWCPAARTPPTPTATTRATTPSTRLGLHRARP